MGDQLASDYTWGGDRCVRAGELGSNEEHPCYFCGTPTNIRTATYCTLCGFYQCSVCGRGYCNTSLEERAALRYLRDKYCCNLVSFEKGFQTEDNEYLKLVPHFIDALNYCRAQSVDVGQK